MHRSRTGGNVTHFIPWRSVKTTLNLEHVSTTLFNKSYSRHSLLTSHDCGTKHAQLCLLHNSPPKTSLACKLLRNFIEEHTSTHGRDRQSCRPGDKWRDRLFGTCLTHISHSSHFETANHHLRYPFLSESQSLIRLHVRGVYEIVSAYSEIPLPNLASSFRCILATNLLATTRHSIQEKLSND